MDQLFKTQIDHILSRGTGIKVCLCDLQSKALLSTLITSSAFKNADFFFFDYLSNRTTQAVDNVNCIVVLHPDNLKELLSELSSPRYSCYYVLFTSRIEPFVIEIIANSDLKGVVAGVDEIHIEALMQYDYLYLVTNPIYRNVFNGLNSILMSLKINPRILSQNYRHFSQLANELRFRCEEFSFAKEGTLLLLQRDFDLQTPLVHDWHYIGMIEEVFGTEAGILTIGGEKHTIRDAFFAENCFKDINALGEGVNVLAKEIDDSKKKIGNYEFEEIENKARYAAMTSTHLKLYTEIADVALGLKKIGNLEMSILRGEQIDIRAETRGLPEDEKLRIFLLYFMKFVTKWEAESRKFHDMKDAIMEFRRRFGETKRRISHSFCPGKDHKLGYEVPLKKVFKQVMIGQESKYSLKLMTEDGPLTGPIVVYIEGGITMAEYRVVMEYAKRCKQEIYFVSDKVFRAKESLAEILSSTKENSEDSQTNKGQIP